MQFGCPRHALHSGYMAMLFLGGHASSLSSASGPNAVISADWRLSSRKKTVIQASTRKPNAFPFPRITEKMK